MFHILSPLESRLSTSFSHIQAFRLYKYSGIARNDLHFFEQRLKSSIKGNRLCVLTEFKSMHVHNSRCIKIGFYSSRIIIIIFQIQKMRMMMMTRRLQRIVVEGVGKVAGRCYECGRQTQLPRANQVDEGLMEKFPQHTQLPSHPLLISTSPTFKQFLKNNGPPKYQENYINRPGKLCGIF